MFTGHLESKFLIFRVHHLTKRGYHSWWVRTCIVRKIFTTSLNLPLVEKYYRHSLLATELLGCLKEQYKVNLTVKNLFEHPTITSVSQFIDFKLNKTGDKEAVNGTKVTYDLRKEVNKQGLPKVK